MNVVLLDNNNYSSPAGGDSTVVVQVGVSYLYGLVALNTSSSTIFVQVFDGYAGPSSGSAPIVQLQVPANSELSLSKQLPLYRWKFINGLTIAASSSPSGYTAVSGTPMMLYCFYSQ